MTTRKRLPLAHPRTTTSFRLGRENRQNRLVAAHFDARELFFRKVALDGHVRVNNVAFSVPPETVGSTVHIRVTGKLPGDSLEVMLNGEIIVVHNVPAPGERRVAANLRLSGIPIKKTLEEFDYAAQESFPKRTIDELATLRFLRNGENILLLGPTGVGKTHCKTARALRCGSTAALHSSRARPSKL
ncbi:MAG: ATP-binding protein [Trueperaceae bacterium]